MQISVGSVRWAPECVMAQIFLSYRRDDSAGHAGRLHDSLEAALGRGRLFMAVDAVPPGVDFAKMIERELYPPGQSGCRLYLPLSAREPVRSAYPYPGPAASPTPDETARPTAVPTAPPGSVAGAWTRVADMPTLRDESAAASDASGRVYHLGGYGLGGYFGSVDVYAPSTDRWSSAASMATARGYFAAATRGDGRVYAIGGFSHDPDRGPQWHRSVEAYSPTADRWSPVADLASYRFYHAAEV